MRSARKMSWAWRCPRAIRASGSLTDADALAKNLGIRYEVLPIEPVFNAVEKQLEKVFAGTQTE